MNGGKAVAVKEDAQISVADIKKFIAPSATEKELFMFMGIAKSYGLNPLKREIHFVKYGSSPASIIVGYEAYIKRAERTGLLDGWKVWIENVGKTDERAVIEIKRKDFAQPIKWEVYRTEFDKGQANWKTMPLFMLRKVAIAQGFRLAFSQDIGGMPYIPEEMPQDKGGGTSETLPKGDVVEAEDVQESELPPLPSAKAIDNYVYPAHCDCGWIGFSDDCSYHKCPNCGARVIKDKDTLTISEPQQKRLFARAKAAGWPNAELKSYLQEVHGLSSTKEIPTGLYDQIVEWVDAHTGYTPKEAAA
jgi:phage recombination protein Bet